MGTPNKLKNLSDTKLRDLYVEQKLSISEIANMYGVCSQPIRRKMVLAGIPRRSRTKGLRICMAKGRGPHSLTRVWLSNRGYKHFWDSVLKRSRPLHDVIWEKANGISLPWGYQVHHLNGNKLDNNPKNLIAIPAKEHKQVHQEYTTLLKARGQRIQELEEQNRRLMKLLKSVLCRKKGVIVK